MRLLIKYINPLIFLLSFFIATGILIYVTLFFNTSLQIIRLQQIYALTAVLYLYLALLASPLYAAFPSFPTRILHVKGRKAIGDSAFFFALTHASLAFFGQLGGINGLWFLSDKYLLAISLSFTALLILSIMALTSLSYLRYLLGVYWKPLHRVVYIAGIFIVIHALMLGTHFSDLSSLIPQIFFFLLLMLLVLEAYRIDLYLHNRFHFLRYLTFIILDIVLISFSSLYLLNSSNQNSPLSVHSQHIAALKSGKSLTNTKVVLLSQNILPNKETEIRFKIVDSQTGQPITAFIPIYEKIVHLIIVNNGLNYYVHLHPQQTGSEFTVQTTFPAADRYHLYFDYRPLKQEEQQSSAIVDAGQFTYPSVSSQQPDTVFQKIFGQYEVDLDTHGELQAEKLSQGTALLTYIIKDAKTGKPLNDLSPYLGAFGHLVMINQTTYDYIHVHPLATVPPKPTDLGGPLVQFTPLSYITTIKPGTYRMFAQFNRKGQLFLADFTVFVR